MHDGRHVGVNVQLDVGFLQMHAAVDERVAQMPFAGPASPRPLLFLAAARGGPRLVAAAVGGRSFVHEYENVEIAERAQFQGGFDQDGG